MMRQYRIIKCIIVSVPLFVYVIILTKHKFTGLRVAGSNRQNFKEERKHNFSNSNDMNQNLRMNQPSTIFSNKLKTVNKEKYIIYYCDKNSVCGGFADRQKGIVMAYLISKLTNRKFGIKITHPSCSFNLYFNMSDIFNVHLNKSISKRHNWVDNTKTLTLVKDINFDSYFKEDVIYFKTNLDYWDQLKENIIYKNQFRTDFNITNDKIFAYAIQQIFRLNTKVSSMLSDFMIQAKPTPKSKLICAQIRTGRNPTIPRDSVTRASAKDVRKVWEFLRQYNNSIDHTLFVTTDSETVRKEAKNMFGSHIVDIKGNIMHSEQASKRKDICEGMEKVILDQQILMRCDVLMISKSGLSRIAAYVRGHDEDLYCLVKGQIKPCIPSKIRSLYGVLG